MFSRGKEKPPAQSPNFLSRITYWYLNGLFATGRKRQITADDFFKPGFWNKTFDETKHFYPFEGFPWIVTRIIPWVCTSDPKSLAKTQVAVLEKCWNEQVKTERPSLARAIFKANWVPLLNGVFWYGFILVSRLALPFIVQEIIGWILSEEKSNLGSVRANTICDIFQLVLFFYDNCNVVFYFLSYFHNLYLYSNL